MTEEQKNFKRAFTTRNSYRTHHILYINIFFAISITIFIYTFVDSLLICNKAYKTRDVRAKRHGRQSIKRIRLCTAAPPVFKLFFFSFHGKLYNNGSPDNIPVDNGKDIRQRPAL